MTVIMMEMYELSQPQRGGMLIFILEGSGKTLQKQ